jgi:tagaturonate reductase
LWQLGAEFKDWFLNACGVYATLVDRIVPGFPRKEIDEIKAKLGYDDNMVVQGEFFHLWVIEAPASIADEFPADKAGLNVLFVPSEEPYHERKVTLLNGPHTVLSPVAYLSGINIVRDACQHPVVGKYINKVMCEELMETLNLPKEELQKFAADVLERFVNPFVDHQVTSIMLNSFPKYETRDLPGLKTYLARKGELPKGLVLGLAAIITYYKGGVREDGAEIVPNDAPEIMALLKELWATGDTRKVAEGVLAEESIWKSNLNAIPGLTDLVVQYLDSIQSIGMLETVKTIL